MPRLFVAFDLDDSVRHRAAGLVQRLRKALEGGGPGRGGSVKWVAPEQMHVTVRFLGMVDPARAGQLQTALAAPSATSAFDAVFEGVGAFPASGPARIVWLGIARGATQLGRLHEEVEARVRAVGLPPDNRSFHAHLTLGRFRRPDPRASKRVRELALSETVGCCRVDEITLYESRLSATGPIYQPLTRTPLAAILGPAQE